MPARVPDGPVTDLLTAPLTPDLVRRLLRGVDDPELGVGIVDLGLVYDMGVAGGDVTVLMTLTTPACPLGGYLEDEIRSCLIWLPQVRSVEVELTFDPPWDPDAMSDAAREQLGWLG